MDLFEEFRTIVYIYVENESESFKLDNFLEWFQKHNLKLIEERENFMSVKEKSCVRENFLNFFKLFKVFLKDTKKFTYSDFKNKYFQNEEIHLFSTIKYLFLEKINLIINEYIIEYKELIKSNFFEIIDSFINKLVDKADNIKNKKDLKDICEDIKKEYDINTYIIGIYNLISLCFVKYQVDNSILSLKKKMEDMFNCFKNKNERNDTLVKSLILLEDEKERHLKEKKILNKKKIQEKKLKELEKERKKKEQLFYYKQEKKILRNYFNRFNIYKNKSKKSKYIIFNFIKYWLNIILYKKRIQKNKIKSATLIMRILDKKNIINKIKYLIYGIKIYNFIYNKYFLKNLKIGDKVILNTSGFFKSSGVNKKKLNIIDMDRIKKTVVLELRTPTFNVTYKGNFIKNIFKIKN
jgi:hypothetical protein